MIHGHGQGWVFDSFWQVFDTVLSKTGFWRQKPNPVRDHVSWLHSDSGIKLFCFFSLSDIYSAAKICFDFSCLLFWLQLPQHLWCRLLPFFSKKNCSGHVTEHFKDYFFVPVSVWCDLHSVIRITSGQLLVWNYAVTICHKKEIWLQILTHVHASEKGDWNFISYSIDYWGLLQKNLGQEWNSFQNIR